MSRDFIANDLRTWKVGDEIVLTAGLIHKEQSDVPRYVNTAMMTKHENGFLRVNPDTITLS